MHDDSRAPFRAVAGPRFTATVERNVPVAMRDGAVLRADVWRPAGAGRHPTILQRLPYDKSDSFVTTFLNALEPLRAVEAGFVVVLQDTRGRYESDGTFVPVLQERQDGADTIAWIARQPFSDGSVCMHGASYVGATQLLAATGRPAGLRALVPHLTSDDYYDGWFYSGGAFQLGFAIFWAVGLSSDALVQRRAAGEDVEDLTRELLRLIADPWSLYERLPLTDHWLFDELCPQYAEWLAHPDRDAYWRERSVREQHSMIDVPALHIGGWADIFCDGTLRNYTGLRDHAATAAARAGQRLLVGPWSHGNPHDLQGDLDHGAPASQLALDMTEVHLDFFRQILAGRSMDAPRVRIFVMGANVWRDEDDWPLARARVQRQYLHSGGNANSAAGDGALSSAAPSEHEPPDRYLYDPTDPVPTVGGATLLPGAYLGARSGPRDQRDVEARSDVLVYTGEPLTADLEVTGPVRLILVASSSAIDTDWTAKLVDVHPDGRAIGIVDGILRSRYRNGFERPVLLKPDEPHEFTIELGATSMLFRAGHRLRLEVSSSNFPRFARHPNIGGDLATAAADDIQAATQSVFHDAARPSYLELPVIE
jgi:putative CocE/NonD family hydrolase